MKNYICVVFALLITSCASSGSLANIEGERVNAWLAKRCPSTEAELIEKAGSKRSIEYQKLTKFLDDLLLGTVDFVFDKATSAIKEAAKKDIEGLSTKGSVPAYLFSIKNVKSASYNTPGCVIVAISDSDPEKWCDAEPLKSTKMCTVSGSPLLQALKSPKGIKYPAKTGSPRFFAEIELNVSNDKIAAIPLLKSIYYPRTIHNSKKFRNAEKIDLSIKIDVTALDGSAAMSTIHVPLFKFIPDKNMIIRSFDDFTPALDTTPISSWVTLAKAPEKLPQASAGTPFQPVNLNIELREVGDPNKFLQFIASYISDNGEELKRKVQETLVPSKKERALATAKTEALDSNIAVDEARAKVYETEAAVFEECKKATSADPDANRLSIRTKFNLAHIESMKLEKVLIQNGLDQLPPNFKFIESKTAFENCKSL